MTEERCQPSQKGKTITLYRRVFGLYCERLYKRAASQLGAVPIPCLTTQETGQKKGKRLWRAVLSPSVLVIIFSFLYYINNTEEDTFTTAANENDRESARRFFI